MYGNIRIEPAELIASGTAIQGNAQSFNDAVKTIYEIVNDLKEAWTGTAASRYVEAIEGFRSDYVKFGELIENLGNLLTAIGKDYESLES